MHTKYDPIVPDWHEELYQNKIKQHGLAGNYTGIPVDRYGHVNFTADEMLEGFSVLVDRVKGDKLNKDSVLGDSVPADAESRAEFLRSIEQFERSRRERSR